MIVKDVAASVIVIARDEGTRIGSAAESLARQTFSETFEVIAVVSGTDHCTDVLLQHLPDARIVRSETGLLPGAARNRGVRAANGEVIAFLPADGVAAPGWLADRVDAHRSGAQIVGGSITDGGPWRPLSRASYLLEYSSLLPEVGVLERQSIPHCLSFNRSVLDAMGDYPDGVVTGEDTLFNRRCAEAGLAVRFVPRAAIGHRGPRSFSEYVRHQQRHGRGLAQCVRDEGLPSDLATGGRASVAVRLFLRYPIEALVAKARTLGAGAVRRLPEFGLLSPLILMGLAATAWGAWEELQEERGQRSRSGAGAE